MLPIAKATQPTPDSGQTAKQYWRGLTAAKPHSKGKKAARRETVELVAKLRL
jgi:hypothetical protein